MQNFLLFLFDKSHTTKIKKPAVHLKFNLELYILHYAEFEHLIKSSLLYIQEKNSTLCIRLKNLTLNN